MKYHPQSIIVKSGSHFNLDARNLQDPDGDSLQFWWFNYPQAGTMKNELVKIDGAQNMNRVGGIAPQVLKTEN